MEQRIGSNSQPVKGEPVTGAGFDPAFIPGITAPTTTAADEPRDAEPTESTDASKDEVKASEASGASGAADASGASEDQDGGPVFEASDRRAKIVADREGVRLSLDEEACEFLWSEIAAVETESPRFGKRFTVTVHTPDRRWFPIEIEATARASFKEWESQLDAVLDAYFETD
ncbi:hypothetical protein ACGFYV_34145 [Streptomyces sp. NPDC048297]|uniref:hypothetical protein n=1 Tax=Streptomyces sp. NPDC048297 TaxID=3365531 RepID=UPI003717DB6D